MDLLAALRAAVEEAAVGGATHLDIAMPGEMAAEHDRRVNAGSPAGIAGRLVDIGRAYNEVVTDVGQRHSSLKTVTLRVGHGSFELKVDRHN